MAAAEAFLPKSRSALVLVDFMNPLDFPGAEELAPAAVSAAREAAKLKAALRSHGVPSIYANDNYGHWQSDFKAIIRMCRKNAGSARAIASLLVPKSDDLTVLKPRHSAFEGSPLELMLKKIGVKKIYIVGLATDMCVQMTAMDAFMQGYKVCVPFDCSAAESDHFHASSIEQMARVIKADVRPWQSMLSAARHNKI